MNSMADNIEHGIDGLAGKAVDTKAIQKLKNDLISEVTREANQDLVSAKRSLTLKYRGCEFQAPCTGMVQEIGFRLVTRLAVVDVGQIDELMYESQLASTDVKTGLKLADASIYDAWQVARKACNDFFAAVSYQDLMQ